MEVNLAEVNWSGTDNPLTEKLASLISGTVPTTASKSMFASFRRNFCNIYCTVVCCLWSRLLDVTRSKLTSCGKSSMLNKQTNMF